MVLHLSTTANSKVPLGSGQPAGLFWQYAVFEVPPHADSYGTPEAVWQDPHGFLGAVCSHLAPVEGATEKKQRVAHPNDARYAYFSRGSLKFKSLTWRRFGTGARGRGAGGWAGGKPNELLQL
jgi:hypothetical protein